MMRAYSIGDPLFKPEMWADTHWKSIITLSLEIGNVCYNVCIPVNLFRGAEHSEATEEDRCGNPGRELQRKLEDGI